MKIATRWLRGLVLVCALVAMVFALLSPQTRSGVSFSALGVGTPAKDSMYGYDLAANNALPGVSSLSSASGATARGRATSRAAVHRSAAPFALVVAAEGGTRVFWSGGQAAKQAAADYAVANGSKTLEMTAIGRMLERIPRGAVADRISKPLWDLASAGFAATARGEANVFIGSEFRGGASIFGRIEGPILNIKGNPILQHLEDAF
ncbi:MAG: hypothetical protein ACR2H3_02520 [Acidimicrobiales bacterium]